MEQPDSDAGYVVQPGDTLEKISKKTGVPVERLKQVNGLEVANDTVAQPVKAGDDEVTGVDEPGQQEAAEPSLKYTVREGESLWLIGRSLGVPYQEIMKANQLTDHLIYPAQELIIPGVDSSKGVFEYRIKKGDTLYFIGLAFGVSYEDIMSLNGIEDIWIYPDQILKIPDTNRSTLYRVREGDTLKDVAGKFKVSTGDITGHQISADSLFEGQLLVIPKSPNVSRSSHTTMSAIDAAADDLELIARAIYGEARGETYEGMVAVGAVILNRLEHKDFPDSVRSIIFQAGAFTAVEDGQINLEPDAQAYKAAREAMDGDDPSMGALYYWNPDEATSKWIWTRPIIKQIGNHVFAK